MKFFVLIIQRLLIFLLHAYRKLISPLFPGSCRFYPTCSRYSLDAIIKHGPAKGLFLTVKRIVKCHPFNPGGYDPVP